MSKIEVNTVAPQCGTTLTLGESGDTVTLGAGASQSGFGRTGTVDWDTTPKTATFSAVSGDGFFCNTTAGAFTCNLPAGAAGAIVSLADYAGTWDSNALTVTPNGSDKIGGVNANVVLNTEGQSVTFVFVDSTQGWVNVQDSTSNERGANFITASGGNSCGTDGNYKYHVFTGPGTFTVSSTSSNAANNVVDYLVVGGGGGGGAGSKLDNGWRWWWQGGGVCGAAPGRGAAVGGVRGVEGTAPTEWQSSSASKKNTQPPSWQTQPEAHHNDSYSQQPPTPTSPTTPQNGPDNSHSKPHQPSKDNTSQSTQTSQQKSDNAHSPSHEANTHPTN